MNAPLIIGAGSGGKGGSGGGGLSEQEDTLKSNAYAQVLDLICEGEIGGLVDGMKSIYLDDTPIQNADGSYNFSGVTYASTIGTQTQGVISGYDQVRNEIAVGVEAKISPGPVVRSITNTNVTSVIVTVQIPQLTYMDAKGNLGGTSVNFAIDVQNDGGGYVEKVNDTITGKSSSAYQRQYRIELPAGGPWDIRLRRITADSTSSQLNNKTVFYSYAEVIDAKLSYPNSALVALKVDASQFRSIPRRGYDVKLLKVRFPTNATVRSDGSLEYDGIWDGTFQTGWCACPAWAYYDLLTTERYGLGAYVDASQADKWALYTISRYCNELIDDGFGGTEPRMTCNVWINTRQEAFKLMSDLASCFRGMAFWSTGTVTAVQDAPADPVFLFTNANVVDGLFAYQGSSAKARHTVALVAWNDPDDLFRQKIEYVEDTDGIARLGVVESEVVAFGCSSRGQAHRVGRWLLYSERFETEVVTFKTGVEATYCRPGDIIKTADQHRAGVRFGGRISSATANTVTVDALATAPSAGNTIAVMGPDGVVQERTVSLVSGATITVTADFNPVPVPQSAWAISTGAVDAQTWRVLAVTETADGTHEIAALEHNAGKFSLVENGLALETRSYSVLSTAPATPTGLTLTELTYTFNNTSRQKVACNWDAATGAVRYRVEWRANSGNYQSDTTTAPFYEIFDAQTGPYDVRVTAINSLELPSAGAASASITVAGATNDAIYTDGTPIDDLMPAEPMADVTSSNQVVITLTTDKTVAADYAGTVASGDLSALLWTPTVTRGGTSIKLDTGTTYALSNQSGGTFAVDNTGGSTSKGNVTISAMTANTAQADLTVTVGGVAQPKVTLRLSKVLGDPPATGSAGAYPKTVSWTGGDFTGINTTSYTTVVAAKTVTLASGESLYGTAPLDYNVSGTTLAVRTMTFKWQYAVAGSGSWNDFGSGITGSGASSAYVGGSPDYIYYDPVPGSVAVTQTATSLSAGDYDVRLVAICSATGRTCTPSGTATIQAKV